jgi:hypothetical protein
MAFNIQQFRSEMVGDGARPNLFEVTMQFPAFSGIANAATKLTFMCKSAQLPGSTVGVVPVSYFGRELKFAGNRVFADWAVTIINDEDFVVRNAFEKWMEALNSHQLNIRNPAALANVNYTVNADVTQYGKTGVSLKKYKLIGVFPSDVSPIELDWGANDQMEEFSVALAYQWWESAEIGI